MDNFREIFLLICSLIFAFLPFIYDYINDYEIEIPDIIWGICFLFVCPTLIILFLFSSSATTTSKEVALAQPVDTLACVSRDDGMVTYVDDSGKEVTLELNKNTEVYHKEGTKNKIKYVQNDYYTIIGHKTGSEIAKVTIYKKVSE